MGGSNDPLSLLDRIYNIDLSTKKGALAASVANVVAVALAAEFLATFGLHLLPLIYILAIAAIEVVIVALSLYRLWLRPFDPKTMAIAFAIQPDTEAKDLNDKLRKTLEREIQNRNLTDVVSVKKLPHDRYFSVAKQAERYLQNKGLRALVWGGTETGTSNGEKISVFHIQVSYQHSPIDQAHRDNLVGIVQRGVIRTGWSVSHDQSLNGISVLGTNVIEVGLYALAVCLISEHDPEFVKRGIGVLEHLHSKLATRVEDQNFPNLEQVRDDIRKLLVNVYTAMSTYSYMDLHDSKTAYEWTKKALTLEPSNYLCNIQAARLAWDLGDEAQAQTYTAIAGGAAPKESLHKLNLAFFQLEKGHYGKAIVRYKEITSTIYRTNIPEVVEFIERRHDATKNPALLFAAGWISYKFGDKTRGAKLLKQFQAGVSGDNNYAPLLKEADKLLK